MFKEAIQPLQQTVMRLGDIGKAAVGILEAAETSDFDHIVVENSFRSYENSINTVHADFAEFCRLFESVAKDAGVSTHEHGHGRRESPPVISGLTAVEMATDAKRVVLDMKEAIPEATRIGATLIDHMNRISLRENVGDDERTDLVDDVASRVYQPFCEAVHRCFGLVGGVVRRVSARAQICASHSIQVVVGKTDEDIGVLSPSVSKAVVESFQREAKYGLTAPSGRLSTLSSSMIGFMTEEWWRGMHSKIEIPGADPVYASNVVEAARIKAMNPGSSIVENEDGEVPRHLAQGTDLATRLPWASSARVPTI